MNDWIKERIAELKKAEQAHLLDYTRADEDEQSNIWPIVVQLQMHIADLEKVLNGP